MNILVPKNLFWRVKDKFVADFIDYDQDVPTNPTLLYKKIFSEAHATGTCTLPQVHLATQCKFSVRALQHALRRLVALEYIAVKQTPGSPNSYILRYSQRVQDGIAAYDRIASPDWYPRSAAAVIPPEIPVTSPDVTPIPSLSPSGGGTHQVRGGGEPGACPSYNVYKKGKNLSPHSPLPQTPCAVPPDTSVSSGNPELPKASGGGDSFSRGNKKQRQSDAREKSIQEAFATLYAAWPVKKDQERASRIFSSMHRAGDLPELNALLATVENFAAHDRHWRNGYAPLLSTWLKGKRWHDEPLPVSTNSSEHGVAPSSSSSGVQTVFSASHPASPHVLPTLPVPDFAPELTSAVDVLAGFWPETSRTSILASIGLARLRGVSFSQLLEQARTYCQQVTAPKPMNDWMHGVLA